MHVYSRYVKDNHIRHREAAEHMAQDWPSIAVLWGAFREADNGCQCLGCLKRRAQYDYQLMKAWVY